MGNSITERVGKLEIAISTLVRNINEINSSIANGFSKVDENFKQTNEKIDAIRGGSTSSLHSLDLNFKQVDENFKQVNENFKQTNQKIDAIRGGSTSSLHTIDEKLSDLTNEISKINHVTKYDGLFDNMKIVTDNTNKKKR